MSGKLAGNHLRGRIISQITQARSPILAAVYVGRIPHRFLRELAVLLGVLIWLRAVPLLLLLLSVRCGLSQLAARR